MKTQDRRAEASLWIIRLHGPQRTSALEAGFREWMAADPENASEFERVTEVWDSMGALSNAALPHLERWEPPARRPLAARAAAALLACGILAGGGYWLMRDPFPTYATDIGEQRIVRLDDGTRISLNSRTRLTIAYDETERRVRLVAGEAFFEVARDPARPFKVIAGDRQVTALGTSFVVRYEPDRVAVSLVEGKVSVAPTEAGEETRTLAPGERLIAQTNEPPRVDTPRMEVVTAWRRGEVILDKTPLAEAVAEMNRYDTTTLIIEDETLAQLRVSGVYKTGDSASFAQAAARMLGLQAAEEGGRIYLRQPGY